MELLNLREIDWWDLDLAAAAALIRCDRWAAWDCGFGIELGEICAKDAPSGDRLSAPGSEEVIVLDLGAAFLVLDCRFWVVYCSA